MLRITEIFHSIQGESTHAGRRCAFVRLAGCNLRCSWCDSAYTFSGGERLTVDEILAKLRGYGCDLVEVTGGEPLAQAECLDLIRALCDEGFEVLVETSGSIDIEPVDRRAKLIVDVKCPGSGEVDRNHWANLDRLMPHDEVKFVIADRADYEWSRDLVAARGLAKSNTVLFSPVWNALGLKELAGWMIEDRVPARLQTQMHKHIWGADVHGV